ncbi:MAG: cupin domain-containing protein [Hyphomonadaceae bacterium]
MQKLPLQPGMVFGPATAFPALKADDGAAIRMGVTEFAVGEYEMDLTYDEGLYILEGEISLEADGETHQLKVGDFLWMPANRRIVYRAKQRCKFLYVIPQT